MSDVGLDGLITVFHAETAENLVAMEQALLALEGLGTVDAGLLDGMLRAAHTIKGNSQMVGYDDVAAATHEIESDLERLRDGGTLTPAMTTALLDAVDGIRTLVLARGTDAPRTTHDARSTTHDARRTSLRVDTDRLDTLLDLTGEITITRGRLSQLLGGAASADATVGATLWQLEQLHASLQGEVMALRMVPLGPVFEALRRTIRDTAARLDKRIRLVLEGHDVEVDTSIAEQMRDPLTHMVRNAADHGIASDGTIVVRASHQAGTVVIEVEDDGRGLDRARIAAKAEARGLVGDGSSLGDAELLALIFEPGFSTAGEVTAVSGRGVGMDVVKRHVEALRGTIDVASQPGRGTRFTIRLPLTVAIIAGFTVGVGDERYVLPLETVEECLDFGRARTNGAEDEGVLELRGAPLPWLRLGDVLGLPAAPATRASAVVIRHAGRRVGLVVDVLDGDCQAVIKPLSDGLQRVPGIAGSTILGDGRVALILNVPQLVDIATARSRR